MLISLCPPEEGLGSQHVPSDWMWLHEGLRWLLPLPLEECCYDPHPLADRPNRDPQSVNRQFVRLGDLSLLPGYMLWGTEKEER